MYLVTGRPELSLTALPRASTMWSSGEWHRMLCVQYSFSGTQSTPEAWKAEISRVKSPQVRGSLCIETCIFTTFSLYSVVLLVWLPKIYFFSKSPKYHTFFLAVTRPGWLTHRLLLLDLHLPIASLQSLYPWLHIFISVYLNCFVFKVSYRGDIVQWCVCVCMCHGSCLYFLPEPHYDRRWGCSEEAWPGVCDWPTVVCWD